MMYLSKIKPTDVRVYIEDGIPYLDYIGIAETDCGKVKVHIPKLGLDISTISKEEETIDYHNLYGKIGSIRTKLEIFAENDKWCECKIIEREMSKEQIEKELGYKVKIK